MTRLVEVEEGKVTIPTPKYNLRRKGLRKTSGSGLVWVLRIFSFTSYFLVCCAIGLGILVSQIIGTPLYFYSKPIYYKWMARTKQHFGVLVTTITQWWAPTFVRVTGTRDIRQQMRRTEDGRLECEFPERMVLIANHQLYSDWLYLWWIAYASKMHGYLYIILKESLKYIPLVGIGMQFYGFIFLSRKWETDKPRFEHRLSKLRSTANTHPMWLLLFPEGTNLCKETRETSARYARKMGIRDVRHCLLPRSTGLQFCLQQLDGSVQWVYDCTMAYEGVPRGAYGYDIFSIYSMYFRGQPPKSVNMHWRRFDMASIPYQDLAKFEQWLRDRWAEKDALLHHFIENGRFPEDDTEEEPVEAEIKLKYWWHAFDVFFVLASVALLANIVLKVYRVVRYTIW